MSNNTYPSRMSDQFVVRLPGDLRARIKIRAAQNRRSMNSEIVSMIEAAMANRLNFEPVEAPKENAPEVAPSEASRLQ